MEKEAKMAEDKWSTTFIEIRTAKPLTDRQLEELEEAIHNSFMAKLEQTYAIDVRHDKEK